PAGCHGPIAGRCCASARSGDPRAVSWRGLRIVAAAAGRVDEPGARAWRVNQPSYGATGWDRAVLVHTARVTRKPAPPLAVAAWSCASHRDSPRGSAPSWLTGPRDAPERC